MTTAASNLRINGERLWDSLMEMARIGPGVRGGNNRQTLTDEDAEGRRLFQRWCEAAGLSVTIDQMGTMFARRPGADESLPPVLVGSHLDTQPTGGKFDGVLGVLGGLEVIRTLNDLGIQTKHPIEVVNWTNEEGPVSPPPCSPPAFMPACWTSNGPMTAPTRKGRSSAPSLSASASRVPRRWATGSSMPFSSCT
jgi:N-carbamoyl-L-amino-acid hydrolase